MPPKMRNTAEEREKKLNPDDSIVRRYFKEVEMSNRASSVELSRFRIPINSENNKVEITAARTRNLDNEWVIQSVVIFSNDEEVPRACRFTEEGTQVINNYDHTPITLIIGRSSDNAFKWSSLDYLIIKIKITEKEPLFYSKKYHTLIYKAPVKRMNNEKVELFKYIKGKPVKQSNQPSVESNKSTVVTKSSSDTDNTKMTEPESGMPALAPIQPVKPALVSVVSVASEQSVQPVRSFLSSELDDLNHFLNEINEKNKSISSSITQQENKVSDVFNAPIKPPPVPPPVRSIFSAFNNKQPRFYMSSASTADVAQAASVVSDASTASTADVAQAASVVSDASTASTATATSTASTATATSDTPVTSTASTTSILPEGTTDKIVPFLDFPGVQSLIKAANDSVNSYKDEHDKFKTKEKQVQDLGKRKRELNEEIEKIEKEIEAETAALNNMQKTCSDFRTTAFAKVQRVEISKKNYEDFIKSLTEDNSS